MQDIEAKVRVPKSVKRGEIFEVKTLVKHLMETGLRKDKVSGAPIPRDIINSYTAVYNGKEVLRAVWHPSVSANPYTSFFLVAVDSGALVLTWTDDSGASASKEVAINVVG